MVVLWGRKWTILITFLLLGLKKINDRKSQIQNERQYITEVETAAAYTCGPGDTIFSARLSWLSSGLHYTTTASRSSIHPDLLPCVLLRHCLHVQEARTRPAGELWDLLTAVNINYWDVTPCALTFRHFSFRSNLLLPSSFVYSVSENNTSVSKVKTDLPNYTVSQPTRIRRNGARVFRNQATVFSLSPFHVIFPPTIYFISSSAERGLLSTWGEYYS